jgi:GTP:adenosylcobinamide-phosphate guanylyltransferase
MQNAMTDARAIVLAAQRKGVKDPLATRFGVSHKCLIPLQGQELIAYVMRTLAAHPSIESVIVSIEPELFEEVDALLQRHIASGAKIRFSAAADNIADSVGQAAHGHPGKLIVTTADNALLKPASLDAMIAALETHNVAIAMSPRESVLAAHSEGQRRFYRFRDGEFSNCNLYALRDAGALDAAEFFRGGGQFAKKASRIVQAFGLINLLLLRFRLVSLPNGLDRIARRIGLSIAPVILTDGTQAIDVDNDRTYAIVESLIVQQAG